MNILQLTSFYPPYLGGAERHVYNLVRFQRILGNNVHVITSDYPRENFAQKGMTRLPVLCKPKLVPICPTIFKALHLVKSDVIHAHTPPRFFPEAVTFYKLFAKKRPLVLTYHCHNEGLGSFDKAIWNLHNYLVLRRVFQNAERVIALTQNYRNLIRDSFKIDPEKIRVIPNGVDEQIFNPAKYSTEHCRRMLGISSDKVLLFMGRLVKEKGTDYLLKTLKIIVREMPDLQLLIVGTGKEEENLKTLCRQLDLKSNVRFLGRISDEEVPMVLSAANLLVAPSLAEGLPTVLLEAMAMEKPVVATNTGGVPELIQNGQTGYVVEKMNLTMTAEAILSILSDNSLAKNMGQLGRQIIKSKYSWSIITKDVLKVYDETIACY